MQCHYRAQCFRANSNHQSCLNNTQRVCNYHSRARHRHAVIPITCQAQESLVPTAAKAKVRSLLAEGFTNYNQGKDLGPAVEQLIGQNPNPSPAPAVESRTLGQGVWQVFYAPHIASLSSSLGAKFEPIQYILQEDNIVSHVKYSHSLFGEGWLSAAGTLTKKYDDTMLINFTRFWVDLGADNLRRDITPGSKASIAGLEVDVDSIIGSLGRAAFFPQFASFPVLYLDEDMAVFKFPPLDSNIAVTKLS